MSDDDDKTVFGQRLPPAQPRRPTSQQQQPAQPPAEPQDRTVFGSALPSRGGRTAPAQPPRLPIQPQPQPPQAPPRAPTGMTWLGEMPAAPQPQQPTTPYSPLPPQTPQAAPPRQNAPQDDTWLGGALNPQGYAPSAQPQQPPTNAYGQPARPAQYTPQGYAPSGSEMFPEIPQAEAAEAPRQAPRIALADALRGTGLGAGGSSNPLVAAAANLLILLGRLRSGVVEMQDGPLIDHVAREIELFERNALEKGVPAPDVSDGKYALSATADDIVQNLPGADKGVWLQYSMTARFFGERSSGVGFFQKMDAAMRAPAQKFDLLELMLTCLSLGFMGQYRTAPNGASDLARIRMAIYESLRRVKPRPDDDVSVRWTPVPAGRRKRFGGIPMWIVAAVAAALVVGVFALLSTLLSNRGGEAQAAVLGLHDGLPAIAIERSEASITPFVAPDSTQLQRISEALADRIGAGDVVVEERGDFVLVRVGDALRFGSGSADLENDFQPLARDIARALEPEPGAIRVVGHTDSVPLSGRGRFKTNEALSEARAETAGGILAEELSDAGRVSIEGVGPAQPIADNATAEGRALNRRVEIMIPREGSL